VSLAIQSQHNVCNARAPHASINKGVYDSSSVTRQEFRLSHAINALQAYVNHIITAASSVRGSSQLTLHLQSPAAAASTVAQQAAAAPMASSVRRKGQPAVELLDGIVRATHMVSCAVCMPFAFCLMSRAHAAQQVGTSCGSSTVQRRQHNLV
jgi:hypothetical protein